MDWRFHLRACQTLIDAHAAQYQFHGVKITFAGFLLKEVADLEMLSGISVFQSEVNPNNRLFLPPSS
jgi:hypothetical protein